MWPLVFLSPSLFYRSLGMNRKLAHFGYLRCGISVGLSGRRVDSAVKSTGVVNANPELSFGDDAKCLLAVPSVCIL